MPDAISDSIPLVDLSVGQSGVLSSARDGEVPVRLLELGFIEGTPIKVIRSGVLGDPIELELRGYRICLRRRDLAGVRVAADRP